MALMRLNLGSRALGMTTDVLVALPETTRGQIGMEGAAGESWPVLYLLHGMSDDETIWERRTSVERYAIERGLAVVMPTCHLGWYTDMHFGPNYYTYVTDELPQIMRNLFPRMARERERTFVAGLSMGGYGAVKCALGRPDVFSFAASLSGAVDVARSAKTTWRGSPLFENIFGDLNELEGSDNDLFHLAEALPQERRPRIYMWCGTEDFLYESNQRFRDHLTNLGYELTYEESPGDHQWKYWDAKIQTVLSLLPIGGGEKA